MQLQSGQNKVACISSNRGVVFEKIIDRQRMGLLYFAQIDIGIVNDQEEYICERATESQR
jgi:folate-dependent phosphoribosylglycinamide formyltransferase PurN